MWIQTLSSRQPQGGGRFVQCPYGFDARHILCHASLTQQVRGAIVAFGCVKTHARIITLIGCPLGIIERMLTRYHIEILLNALGEHFSPRALSAITNANIYQDGLSGLFGHDEYHCDNNAFEKTYAYMEEQRALVVSSLRSGDADSAWGAFGRFLHSAQDFYAHSNYITLWLARFDGQTPPPSSKVDPVDSTLIQSPDLRSGKVYYPFEFLYYYRKTRNFSLRYLPHDSHAWMNLDSPEQGFKFDYAMQAAIKRTVIEYDKTTSDFSQEMCMLFLDK